MPIGTPEGFLDITNATLRTSVVGISNTGPTGELSVGSNLHVDTTASNVLQVVGNVSSHNMTLGEISLVPAHGLENVTEVGNTTPYTVSFSNATTGLATTSNLHVGGSLKVGVIDFVNPGLTLATVTNNSNVTPYTIDLRNATTGLVTTSNVVVGGDLQVAGNATVTGDLNVSGALGILDAIYPVGSIIDRATAITDTHLDGKFKAFLAAPNQRWELLSTTGPTFSTNISFAVDYNSPTATYSNQLIPLTLIHTNVGSSWDSASNTFIVPADGNYVFGINYQQEDANSRIEIRRTRGGTTTTIGDLLQYNENPTYVYAGYFNYGETLMAPLQANDIVFLWADGNLGGGVTLEPFGSATHPSTPTISHLHFYGHFVSPAVETTTYVYKRIAD